MRNRLNEIEARYSRSVSELIENMLQPDPKKRLSATQVFEVFQKPNAPLRTSLPKIEQIPINAPGGSQINPFVPGRDSKINPST